MEIADVLEKAANLIEPEGAWCQRSNFRGAAVCVGQAIRETGAGADIRIEARRLLLLAAGADSVTGWNDAPERTQQEVVATLRKAAAKARDQPNV